MVAVAREVSAILHPKRRGKGHKPRKIYVGAATGAIQLHLDHLLAIYANTTRRLSRRGHQRSKKQQQKELGKLLVRWERSETGYWARQKGGKPRTPQAWGTGHAREYWAVQSHGTLDEDEMVTDLEILKRRYG